jgi:hypothetical protein
LMVGAGADFCFARVMGSLLRPPTFFVAISTRL